MICRKTLQFARGLSLSLVLLTSALDALGAPAITSILPGSKAVDAKLMQIGMPRKVQAIAQRLQAALAAQPDWASKFIAERSSDGQALPYHKNFRISELEYQSLLAAAEAPSLVQVGAVRLSTERLPNGRLRLKTEPGSSRLNGIEIDEAADKVTTGLAVLGEVKAVDNQNAKGATGRWAGTQWRHHRADAAGILSVKFALGRRTDAGDGIIYLDVNDARGKEKQVDHEIILFPISE